VAGAQVNEILAEKGKPVVIPIEVECQYNKPCVKYNRVVKHFIDRAAVNTREAMTGKAKSAVQNAVKSKVEDLTKQAPEPVKNILKNIGGGLFGN
jgi:hypothetical protein